MVKGFLSLRDIAFAEKNVSTDDEARSELAALGFDSTPVTVIGNRCIPGFDAALLDEALTEMDR